MKPVEGAAKFECEEVQSGGMYTGVRCERVVRKPNDVRTVFMDVGRKESYSAVKKQGSSHEDALEAMEEHRF